MCSHAQKSKHICRTLVLINAFSPMWHLLLQLQLRLQAVCILPKWLPLPSPQKSMRIRSIISLLCSPCLLMPTILLLVPAACRQAVRELPQGRRRPARLPARRRVRLRSCVPAFRRPALPPPLLRAIPERRRLLVHRRQRRWDAAAGAGEAAGHMPAQRDGGAGAGAHGAWGAVCAQQCAVRVWKPTGTCCGESMWCECTFLSVW